MSNNQPSALSSTTIDVRVYIEDTDAGGIVFYVNYLKYMERARTEFMRQLGFGKAAIFADQLMFVVHSISAVVKKRSKVAVVFEQQVYRDNQLLCEAEVKVACVDRDTQQPAVMPESLIKQIMPH
jgi:4-hydroxybenzoyl-CoA thioesterase